MPRAGGHDTMDTGRSGETPQSRPTLQKRQYRHAYALFKLVRVHDTLNTAQPPTAFAELMGEPGRPVWPLWELLKWLLGRSDHTMAAIGLGLVEMSQRPSSAFHTQQKETLQREVEELLGTDGVLLYPTHPNLAPKHHHALFRPFDFAYTGILNILGLPVTQCPLGLSQEGLPMGVQVVAGKLQDRLSLAVAVYLEETFGGWRDPGAS